jgi:hypothetical protein
VKKLQALGQSRVRESTAEVQYSIYSSIAPSPTSSKIRAERGSCVKHPWVRAALVTAQLRYSIQHIQ